MKPPRKPTAEDLGIRRVETKRREVLAMPKGGLKNTREIVRKITLPRVSILEKPDPSGEQK